MQSVLGAWKAGDRAEELQAGIKLFTTLAPKFWQRFAQGYRDLFEVYENPAGISASFNF